jgi:histidinol-phosphatase
MTEAEHADLLAFAVEIAQEAGSFTLAHYQTGVATESKTDNTPVTDADRGSEQRLRQRVAAAYPDHGIVGEEFGEQPGNAPARWILDPIDGTQSFVCGVPLYSVLVGLEWQGEMVVGVIHLPALRETVYAARGLGCWWNGRRARVSDVAELSAARLCLTSVKTMVAAGRGAAYARLRDAVAIDRGWSDAYGYALLATGRIDVMVDPLMSVWDTAALVPIVQEAGGRISDWSGTVDHRRPEVIATNGHLHPAVLEIVGGEIERPRDQEIERE